MTSNKIRNATTTIAVKKPGKNAGIRRNNNKKKKNVGAPKLIRNVSFKGKDFISPTKGTVNTIKIRI
ncbi:hypothetical protein RGU76_28610 [Bacillus pseudomycoides]|nr:hypothetical protein [Bacillus pseudomycoides]